MSRNSYTAIDFVPYNQDPRYFVAYTAADSTSESFTPGVKKKSYFLRKLLGLNTKDAPLNLTLERISVFCSLICLLTSLVIYANKKGNNLKVRLSRETLIFSPNGTNVEDGMRLLHSTWEQDCGAKYPMLLQTPTWQKNETGVVMHSSVYATDIYIFPLAFIVFTTSIFFQGWRCWQYDRGEGRSKNRLYNPEKGPEFSRWLEYFFTSPLQILIVSSSFGFATVDALIGQSGMQAALVLLGYSIEQQIKKIYKRKSVVKQAKKFEHLFAPWVPDIRLLVYLLFAWALHVAIWGIPGITGFGIGGKYDLLQKQLETCVHTEPKMKIPDAVTWIYWLQYVFFTLFGIVCSLHVCWAEFSFNGVSVGQDMKELSKPQWNFISRLYGILSVSAKTALEAGLVMYVNMYEEWQLLPAATITPHAMQNETCWAIKP
jgi:hypothetical protein